MWINGRRPWRLAIPFVAWGSQLLSAAANDETVLSFRLIPHRVVVERQRRLHDQREVIQRPPYSRFDPRALLPSNSTPLMASLYQGYGTHYIDAYVGYPIPQRQTLIVDTGSHLIAFPCNSCQHCGGEGYHTDGNYDSTQSETFRKLTCRDCLRGRCDWLNVLKDWSYAGTCNMSAMYAEGSGWKAFEAEDVCYVGGTHDGPVRPSDNEAAAPLNPYHASAYSFFLKFGCQTSLSGLFKTQLADGILGMNDDQGSLWRQMYQSKVIASKSFCLCFARSETVARNGTEAGALTLGGVDDRLEQSPLVYAEMKIGSILIIMRGFYTVEIRAMYLRAGGGGVSAIATDPSLRLAKLNVTDFGKVIVDSGTTDSSFSSIIGPAFREQYRSLTGRTYSHGAKKISPQELAQEPTILLQLVGHKASNIGLSGVPGLASASSIDPEHPEDVILAVPPEHYYEYDAEKQGYKSRFFYDSVGYSLLGANSMMGHNVNFDLDNMRMGWSESACNYRDVVKDFQAPPPTSALPYLPPRTKYPVKELQGFCSTELCVVGTVFGVMAAILLVVALLIQRSKPDQDYIEVPWREVELAEFD